MPYQFIILFISESHLSILANTYFEIIDMTLIQYDQRVRLLFPSFHTFTHQESSIL